MKNFITLALVIGFSAFAITACGDKDDDSSNTEAEEVQEEESAEEVEAGEGGDPGEAGEAGEAGEGGEAEEVEVEVDAGVDADAAVSYLEFAPMHVTVASLNL